MKIKASTPERIISFNNSIIVISLVKGDSTLYRVMIDSGFKGYVQKMGDGLHRVDGNSIKDSEFEAICDALELVQ